MTLRSMSMVEPPIIVALGSDDKLLDGAKLGLTGEPLDLTDGLRAALVGFSDDLWYAIRGQKLWRRER